MPDIYNAIIQELEYRQIAKVEEFYPYYIASIGCHMFNIVNREREIYKEGGVPADTRIHIMYCTVPGFGKTFILRQFMENEEYSILLGSDVQCVMEGSTTEAGLTGSADTNEEGKTIKKTGLYEEEKDSIVGIEEFSAYTNASKQDYNANLDTSLLTGLDSGDYNKRLKGIKIKGHTNMTLWGGVQPSRYDLSGGMGRRMIFLVFIPSYKDVKEFKKKRREMKGIIANTHRVNAIKMSINQRFKEIRKDLTGITFSHQFYQEMDNLNVMFYEEPLYERIALGYWLMKSETIKGVLDIRVNEELSKLMWEQKRQRRMVKKGDMIKIQKVLEGVDRINEDDLVTTLLEFGMPLNEIYQKINILVDRKWIKREGGYLVKIKDTG